jgi:8-oxo-dGTP pyrophosphatase MutT (NUDIX family)
VNFAPKIFLLYKIGKLKKVSFMTRKARKVLKQSGVIPYRVTNGRIEVLLVTTSDCKNWVIPKGGICNGMSPPASAAKEAWEEAGVIGQVNSNEVGTYKYRKQGKTYEVQTFLLAVDTVLSDWPEANQRRREWLEPSKAIRRVKKGSLKQILKGFSCE